MQWEYHTASLDAVDVKNKQPSEIGQLLVDQFDSLGADQWQLVCSFNIQSVVHFLFKRPKAN